MLCRSATFRSLQRAIGGDAGKCFERAGVREVKRRERRAPKNNGARELPWLSARPRAADRDNPRSGEAVILTRGNIQAASRQIVGFMDTWINGMPGWTLPINPLIHQSIHPK